MLHLQPGTDFFHLSVRHVHVKSDHATHLFDGEMLMLGSVLNVIRHLILAHQTTIDMKEVRLDIEITVMRVDNPIPGRDSRIAHSLTELEVNTVSEWGWDDMESKIITHFLNYREEPTS